MTNFAKAHDSYIQPHTNKPEPIGICECGCDADLYPGDYIVTKQGNRIAKDHLEDYVNDLEAKIREQRKEIIRLKYETSSTNERRVG